MPTEHAQGPFKCMHSSFPSDPKKTTVVVES